MAEGEGGPLISTREEWHIHCEAIHNDTSPSTGVSLGSLRKRQRRRDDASDTENLSRKRSILSREGSAPSIDPALFQPVVYEARPHIAQDACCDGTALMYC